MPKAPGVSYVRRPTPVAAFYFDGTGEGARSLPDARRPGWAAVQNGGCDE